MANIRKRSGDAFAQVDNYLIALKMLGIPSGEVPTLDALVSANDSAKIFFNTLKKAFQVYVDGVWIDTEVNLSDYYNKQEVDNLISGIINGMDWKAAVATYDDLATEYPSPEQGWTVTVNDESVIYQYDGSQWVDIGDMLIPMADATRDGRMSKEDFVKLRDIEAEATKNKSDTYLLDLDNAEGTLGIEKLTGFIEAPVNSMPFKNEDGTEGWKVQIIPKKFTLLKSNGEFLYFDTLNDAINASFSYPNCVIKMDSDDESLPAGDLPMGNLHPVTLDTNGFSIKGNGLQIGGYAKVIGGGTLSRLRIFGGATGGSVEIIANIDAKGSDVGIDNPMIGGLNITIWGNVVSENIAIRQAAGTTVSGTLTITVYGDVISGSGSAIIGRAVVYGNVISSSESDPAIQDFTYNTAWAGLSYPYSSGDNSPIWNWDFYDNRVYGSVININPDSTAEVMRLNSFSNWHIRGGVFTAGSGYGVKMIGYDTNIPDFDIDTDGRIVGPNGERFSDPVLKFWGTNLLQNGVDPETVLGSSPPVLDIQYTHGGGSGYSTPAAVRDALQTLTLEERLDASAIKNLPSGTGLTPEQEAKLENTPNNTIEELGGKAQRYVTVSTSFVVGDCLGIDISDGAIKKAKVDIEPTLLVVEQGKAIKPGDTYNLGLPVGGYFYNEITQSLTLTKPSEEGEVVRPAYIQGDGFGVFLYSQGYQIAGELQFDDESTTLDESFEI